jgi:hypothetical protein
MRTTVPTRAASGDGPAADDISTVAGSAQIPYTRRSFARPREREPGEPIVLIGTAIVELGVHVAVHRIDGKKLKELIAPAIVVCAVTTDVGASSATMKTTTPSTFDKGTRGC